MSIFPKINVASSSIAGTGPSLKPSLLFFALALMLTTALSAEEGAPQTRILTADRTEIEIPPGREWVEVPFRLDATKIVLPLRINGSEPVDAVLDTGASSALLLDHEVAAGIDFNIVGEAQVGGAGAGGSMPKVEVARSVRFELGDVALNNVNLAVMRGPNPMAKQDWQAIIGEQIFANLVVQIDWQAKVLRLADPAQFKAPPRSNIVPIERKSGHVFARGEVTMGAQGDAQPVKLVIDSGAFHALALDARRFESLPESRIDGAKLGRGLGGVIQGSIGRVHELRLGGFSFKDVITRFPDATFADVITSREDGNLGAEILRRFIVTFDYSRDQMILEPTPAVREEFAFSTSGFAFFPALNDDGAGVIDDLYANSPASEAGLQDGDEIVRINGKLLVDLGLDQARILLEQTPGTLVTLDVQRGNESFKVDLKLARLL